jgi:hypothetical protein
MYIPDQVAYAGGSFFCPNCRAQNFVGGHAQPVASMTSAAPSTSPTPAKQPRHVIALAVLFVVAVIGILLPVLSVVVGLACVATAMGYVKRPGFESAINRALELNQSSRMITIARAAIVGVWGVVALIGFPIWLSIDREIDRREAAKAKEENEAEAKRVAEAKLAAEAQAAAEAEAKRVAHEQELAANAAKTAVDFGTTMDTVDSQIAAEQWLDAKATLSTIEISVAEYRELKTNPTTMTDAIARYDALHKRIMAVMKVLERAGTLNSELEAGLNLTKGTKDGAAWKAAKAHWERASVEADELGKVTGEAVKYVPTDLSTLRKKIEKSLKAAEKIVEKYEKELAAAEARREQEKAIAEAYIALCGPEPVCGGWDGECVGIESALKQVAHDPRSIDVESCTTPKLTADYCWVTTCSVRGKNPYGALVLSDKTFSLSTLGVSEL